MAAGLVYFAFVSLTLIIVGVSIPNWVSVFNHNIYMGLWKICYEKCTYYDDMPTEKPGEKLTIVLWKVCFY